MKKFTLTLVLLFIIAIAFGQRANKFAQFTKVSPYSMKKPIEAQNGEKGALNPIWTELFTDSGTVVVNGLPDDFSYTPNATSIDDQWHWISDGSIGHAWTTNHAINEVFTTGTYGPVPSVNPTLYFEFE